MLRVSVFARIRAKSINRMQNMDGICMMQDSLFRFLVMMENWKDTMCFMQGYWCGMRLMEKCIYCKYPNIDMERTGEKMQWMVKKAGYSVKDIQKYLNLSCPQPIYRWFKGKVLPTVDHLYALSILLKVHMEELLVKEHQLEIEMEIDMMDRSCEHLISYYKRLLRYVDFGLTVPGI